jgi:RNA polymerase sigma-70 factor (sigma-E family)
MGPPLFRRTDEAEFREFVAESSTSLSRIAFLLCGDRHFAQDLVQNCLVRLYQAWPRIREPDAYARRVLLRCWINELRRPWRRAERQVALPELADPAEGTGSADLRDVLRRALAEIPPRQRATVVLRYMCELSVSDTAAALRCSEGTVRSQATRGLAALRAGATRFGLDTQEMRL